MEKTKQRLAIAIEDIMQTKPLEKITIQEICDHSFLTRQTFYHHFKDKYDLVNWIFDCLFENTFYKIGQHSPWRTNIEIFLGELKVNKIFYSNAYKYLGQNSLEHHHYQRVYDFYFDFFEKAKGDKLTPEEDFCLELYCRGAVFMVANWGRNGMQESPEYLTELFRISMPDNIMHYLIV